MIEEELFTAEEIAEEIGVKPSLIYVWVHRSQLAPVAKRGRYKLFRLSDAFAAEVARSKNRHPAA